MSVKTHKNERKEKKVVITIAQNGLKNTTIFHSHLENCHVHEVVGGAPAAPATPRES